MIDHILLLLLFKKIDGTLDYYLISLFMWNVMNAFFLNLN